jgi:hypothetical protein
VFFLLKAKLESEHMAEKSKARKDHKVDKAVDMTFPASDAPARGGATSTEAPRRPASREAPLPTKDQIEQAQRGEGHAHDGPHKPKHPRAASRR